MIKMKTSYKFLVLLGTALFFSSCDEGDVFTGSPVGTNVQFETIQGTITTTETHAVSGEIIPITVSIPNAFPFEVKVQAMAFLPNTNKRTTKTVLIPAGATSADSTMQVPGAEQSDLPFHMNLELSLVAITTGDEVLPTGFAGKQYKLTSDKVVLDFGDSSLPALNANRLIVKFDFEFPNNGNPSSNNLNLSFKKNGVITAIGNSSATSAPVFGTLTASARYETVNFNNAVAEDGTYTLSAFAQKLKSTPSDVDYRFVVRFPNDVSKVYSGTLTGLTVGNAASAIPVLQIVKSTIDGVAHYDVTQL
jgi:hypothetical protein